MTAKDTKQAVIQTRKQYKHVAEGLEGNIKTKKRLKEQKVVASGE